MPLVAHNELPTFDRLRDYGQNVLTLEQALHQDIRELHIGLLNMMPDAALSATEAQFIRMVGNSNTIAQFYVYPFSIAAQSRSPDSQRHIDDFYYSFDTLREQGLDALIITGANVINPSLDQEAFWDPLIEIVHWADNNVASVLCSCLATHALVKFQYGIERRRMPEKKWGVYNHTISDPTHPLMRGINSRFDLPHSRYNDVSRQQMEEAGLHVLIESEEAGVHLAVSPDGFRNVLFQGHPEYMSVSLLKEYKREVRRYQRKERDSRPRYPAHYFSGEALQIVSDHLERVERAMADGGEIPALPEKVLASLVDNTWGDTGKAIVNNWLGLVYRLTNLDRTKQFMQGVDPDDPLQLHQSASI